MPLDLNELRELLAAINQTEIAELTLKSADFELTVRRGTRSSHQPYLEPPIAAEAPDDLLPPAPSSLPKVPIESPPASPKHDRRLIEINALMVGTFYRSPAPSEPAFIELGDRVQAGQTVCIIEAMKLMNEIETEITGEIVEILVQNGEPVEYGQPLMRVNPA